MGIINHTRESYGNLFAPTGAISAEIKALEHEINHAPKPAPLPTKGLVTKATMAAHAAAVADYNTAQEARREKYRALKGALVARKSALAELHPFVKDKIILDYEGKAEWDLNDPSFRASFCAACDAAQVVYDAWAASYLEKNAAFKAAELAAKKPQGIVRHDGKVCRVHVYEDRNCRYTYFSDDGAERVCYREEYTYTDATPAEVASFEHWEANAQDLKTVAESAKAECYRFFSIFEDDFLGKFQVRYP